MDDNKVEQGVAKLEVQSIQKLNGTGYMPTIMTRGIGPFYPIRGSMALKSEVERAYVHDENWRSTQSNILLGPTHAKLWLLVAKLHAEDLANGLYYTNYHMTYREACWLYGMKAATKNLTHIHNIFLDLQRLYYTATAPVTVYHNEDKPYEQWMRYEKPVQIALPDQNVTPESVVEFHINPTATHALLGNNFVKSKLEFIERLIRQPITTSLFMYYASNRYFYKGQNVAEKWENLMRCTGLDLVMELSGKPEKEAKRQLKNSALNLAKLMVLDVVESSSTHIMVRATDDFRKKSKAERLALAPKDLTPKVQDPGELDNASRQTANALQEAWRSLGLPLTGHDVQMAFDMASVRLTHWSDRFRNRLPVKLQYTGPLASYLVKAVVWSAERRGGAVDTVGYLCSKRVFQDHGDFETYLVEHNVMEPRGRGR